MAADDDNASSPLNDVLPRIPQHRSNILKIEERQRNTFIVPPLPQHTNRVRMGSRLSSTGSPLKFVQSVEDLPNSPPEQKPAPTPSPLQNAPAYPSPDPSTSIHTSPSQPEAPKDSFIASNAVFRCPYTGYPNLVWLKGKHMQLINNYRDTLIQDDSTQFVIFSNRADDLAREEADGVPTMEPVVQRSTKVKYLSVVLREHVQDDFEIVVTNFGGAERYSDELMAFVEFVRGNAVLPGGQM